LNSDLILVINLTLFLILFDNYTKLSIVAILG